MNPCHYVHMESGAGEPLSLTVRQLAKRWNYESLDAGDQAIRRLIRSKQLPAFKVGRAYRIRIADVEDFEVTGAAA